MKKLLFAFEILAASALFLAGCNKKQASDLLIPRVNIICPYAQNGTADLVARKFARVATRLHPEFIYTVENKIGGDGFKAVADYTFKKENTTDLLIYGYGVAYRHDIGKRYRTETVGFDRKKILPIGMIDDRTWILYTTPDVALSTILYKAKNGALKMSGGTFLSDPHIALASLLAIDGGSVDVVSGEGADEQKKLLYEGKVDVFMGTPQAGMKDVFNEKLVPIVAFTDKAFEGFSTPNGNITVPSIAGKDKANFLSPSKNYSASILSSGGFIATRVGAPAGWVEQQTKIVQDVWRDPEFTDFVDSAMLNRHECYGEEAYLHLETSCLKALSAFRIILESTK